MVRAIASQRLPKFRKILPLGNDNMNFPAASSGASGAKDTSLDGPLVWLGLADLIFLWTHDSVEKYSF